MHTCTIPGVTCLRELGYFFGWTLEACLDGAHAEASSGDLPVVMATGPKLLAKQRAENLVVKAQIRIKDPSATGQLSVPRADAEGEVVKGNHGS